MTSGGDGPRVQVVGISRDANAVTPGESPKTTVYVPVAQEPRAEMTLQLRTSVDVATARRVESANSTGFW